MSFRSILNPSTVASWNSTIRETVGNGLHRDALLLYRRMRQSGFHPDHLTFPFLLKACAWLSDTNLPQMIHTHVLKSSFSSDLFVATAMLDLYAKYRHLEPAGQMFDEMPDRDVVAWNAMIIGLAEMGFHERVFLHFQKMRLDEIKPDSITIISLTLSSAQRLDAGLLKAVHSIGIRIGLGADVSVLNTLIASYANCEELCSAESVFSEIPRSTKSVVSWNSMIAGCAHLGRSDEVASYFRRMSRDDTRPDMSTVLSLLSAFGHSEDLVLGKLVHSLAIKAGFVSDIAVSNTLISLYSKSGDVDAARRCFDSMTERTCVSWTAVISGYSKAGDVNEAMDLFHAMESTGEMADAVTVAAVLSACGRTGSLEFGTSMERYNKLFADVVVCNALIDMYAKCGSLSDARRVFASMKGRNVVSWTALIAGCAMNGEFEEALHLFSQMLELQFKPNHVTFLAVLQACSHGGLVERGWDLFEMMRKVYSEQLKLEHYACMADLLGRKGRTMEALEFIRNMPIEPDCGVWGALLGSCIIHRDAGIGEYAARRLFELDPNDAVSYVSMSNIYASRERWEGVAKVRVMMRRKGVKKSPGQSAVQVNGKAHAFNVDDRVHPEDSIIYDVLDSLALHLKVEDQLEEFIT